MSERWDSPELRLVRLRIKMQKPIVRRAQNAAQFWGFEVPDQLAKIVKRKSIV